MTNLMHHRVARARKLATAFAVIAALWGARSPAQATFQDATSSAGFSFSGESWGASWGDINGDGLPDLFVNHHRQKNAIYKNRGGGLFTDVTDAVDSSAIWTKKIGDSHGGTWADFDNDGDQDLYVAYGSVDSCEILENENGILIDRSYESLPKVARFEGRMPVWLDFSGDGQLDVIMATAGKSYAFRQSAGTFTDVTTASGLVCSGAHDFYYADVTGDRKLDLICGGNQFASKVYQVGTGLPFTKVNAVLPVVSQSQDVAAADFNGDLVTDFVVLRGNKRLSGADQTGPKSVAAQLIMQVTGEKSASFVSTGDLTVKLAIEKRFAGTDIFLGSAGVHPAVAAPFSRGVTTMTLSFSAADTKVVGIAAHNPAARHALYVGYEPATHRWSFIHAPGGTSASMSLSISSTQPVSNVTSLTPASDKPMQPGVLLSGPGGFTNIAAASGLGPNVCAAAAAADFDNDGDVDLYAVCRGATLNVTNRYFDNDGTGRFVEVLNAGGAGGPLGYGSGLGENVIAADYDVDGDVDLFVTNGLSLVPLNIGGPDLLFRNQTRNGNHWIEVDLIATTLNRDATGARVTVKTPDGRQQLREQNGGYHRWSQHDRRLHFGLGSASSATVTVQWPSGRLDTYANVAADGIYQATEASRIVLSHPTYRD